MMQKRDELHRAKPKKTEGSLHRPGVKPAAKTINRTEQPGNHPGSAADRQRSAAGSGVKRAGTAKPAKKSSRLHAPRIHNREYSVIITVFLIFFGLMSAYYINFMVRDRTGYATNAYNPRLSALSEHIARGNIYAADGTVLAVTETEDNGSEIRSYPGETMYAHAVGYNTHGMSGVERDANYELLTSHASLIEKLEDSISGTKYPGDSVTTTLDTGAQEAAYRAIGSNRGAVIALDPTTGKILAMVSKPDYDPQKVAASWKSLTGNSEEAPLLNRSTQGLYPPGSTFKIVTTLAYLRQHDNDTSGFSYDCTGKFTVDDYTIHCAGDETHGLMDLKGAFTHSCNTSFANIGLSLDRGEWQQTCEDEMFNRTLPTRLQHVSKSRFSLPESGNQPMIMQTAIGQGNTLVTPIHMAMLACAIEHNGKVMKPYIIDHISSDTGTVVTQYHPQEAGTLMTPEEAQILRDYMRSVVTDGTAGKLNTENFTAYGKTGTAEYNESGGSHAWFVGFAEKDGRQIAVAVILEGAGTAGKYAVPAAYQVFSGYFGE